MTNELEDDGAGFRFDDASHNASHRFLLPEVLSILQELPAPHAIFDLGCGNGSTAKWLTDHGYAVLGVDPSPAGIRQANESYPDLRLELGYATPDLVERFGTFEAVISLEVVEHIFLPREWAAALAALTGPAGTAIVSTPYHGYWKNLVLSATGKMDDHFTALWDYGHIKFWSIKTLSTLLEEAGFTSVQFRRVGRVPPLARSMIAIARRTDGSHPPDSRSIVTSRHA